MKAETATIEVVERVWTAEELLARYAAEGVPAWADGDEITFFHQEQADKVELDGGLYYPMKRLPDTDLWYLTLRIPSLSKAIISYTFLPYENDIPLVTDYVRHHWRGSEAPPPPKRPEVLAGSLQDYVLDSHILAEKRKLSVYIPPGYEPAKSNVPVIYCADGQSLAGYAAILDPLIVAEDSPSVLLIGIHSAASSVPYSAGSDRRAQEYLPKFAPEKFELHERFVMQEVLGWAEKTLGAATRRAQRVIFGFSNGAAFAIAMGCRHSEQFGHVIAFSLGWVRGLEENWALDQAPDHYLMAGIFEEGFNTTTARWAAKLERSGLKYQYVQRFCGHDAVAWQEEFPRAVSWLFG
jgi:enterochelin esterase-like enzyme